MILAAATVDKPINVDVNVIIHLVDFGNFSTSSSISHPVFRHSRPQPFRRHLNVKIEVRLKMTGFLLVTTWVRWGRGADRAPKLFLLVPWPQERGIVGTLK